LTDSGVAPKVPTIFRPNRILPDAPFREKSLFEPDFFQIFFERVKTDRAVRV
jgi:hypothetical protein